MLLLITFDYLVDEEIPPDNVERFECLEKSEKRYINVTNYYYYYFSIFVINVFNC